jgi:5-methylcytosine-specific restriction endonuclease McrA
MNESKNHKKGFPVGSVCKPCWELKYFPYGYMVEWSPLVMENENLDERKQHYEECLKRFLKGNFKSEEEVWAEVDRLLYSSYDQWEFLSHFDPRDINCKVWGHVCPVFMRQSGATETKEGRRGGRYIPREIMLKVVRRDSQLCQVCFKYVRDDELEFDHIIPVSKGGPTSADNLRVLCRDCNRSKSNTLDEILE